MKKPDTELESAVRVNNLAQETQINNHSCPSQETQILEYLNKGYSLTPLGALKLFNCFRLGARIFRLRKKGYKIKATLMLDPTFKRKRYNRYFLERNTDV